MEAADIAAATAARADWTMALSTDDFSSIRANPDLMARALITAEPLFGQNCQVCHGANGIGGAGFPRLSDDIWLWGATAEEIETTLRYGINGPHPDARYAQMPAFGRDELLTGAQINTLTDYVLTLGAGVAPNDPSEGALLFQENCAACHGENGKGGEGVGAPNLTDSDWIYGGDARSIRHSLVNGRQGVMPAWEPRLTDAEIRILALYVEGLHTTGAEACKPRGRRMHNDPLTPLLGCRGLCSIGLGDRRELAPDHRCVPITTPMLGPLPALEARHRPPDRFARGLPHTAALA